MGNGWLTPDSAPGNVTSRCIFIPDDPQWVAIVAGALIALTFPYNFEQYGTATPDETASVFVDMFDNFSYNIGVCRVIGEIVVTAGTANPNPGNWIVCDGSSLLRSDYPHLFAALGTTYGAGDGTHFNIPDLRGRVALAAGTGPGLSTYALGASGGEEDHTLVTAEVPSHSHIDSGHLHTEGSALPAVGAAIVGVPIPSAVPTASVTGSASANLSSSGGDGAHNNRQPYLALNYLIVALQ